MHQFHNGIGRVNLEPALGKISIVGFLMMIVLEQLAHHQEIKRQGVFAVVVILKIGIAVFVPAPVYYCPMYRAHQKMDRQ